MSRQYKQSQEGTHHERWLVSYADFMTLLFALFVVLFASSYHDKQSIQRVSSAVKSGFQELGSFSSPADTLNLNNPKINSLVNAVSISGPKPPIDGLDIIELRGKLGNAIGLEISHQEITLRITPEGFVISLRELGFFASGQAKLLPGAADKIKRIAAVLMQYGLEMRVEGHSDNVPIHNAEFASNWELSTARATAVATMLLKEERFDPRRLSIAGFAEYHPAESNDTQEGRRANRRVDIVIVADPASADAKDQ
jgi:chemotaxis protein MotB